MFDQPEVSPENVVIQLVVHMTLVDGMAEPVRAGAKADAARTGIERDDRSHLAPLRGRLRLDRRGPEDAARARRRRGYQTRAIAVTPTTSASGRGSRQEGQRAAESEWLSGSWSSIIPPMTGPRVSHVPLTAGAPDPVHGEHPSEPAGASTV